MNRIAIILILIFVASASICFAAGWNDFTLDIGDGYNVFKGNSMDVCIGKSDTSLILCPSDFNNVGPVIKYITTAKYIFTINNGRKPRNEFIGDTFENIDTSKEFYFLITKETDNIIGPMSKIEFEKQPAVTSLAPLEWKTPTNPNFWLPFLGGIIFLALSVPILAVKFYWVSLPVLGGTYILVTQIKKNKRKAQLNH